MPLLAHTGLRGLAAPGRRRRRRQDRAELVLTAEQQDELRAVGDGPSAPRHVAPPQGSLDDPWRLLAARVRRRPPLTSADRGPTRRVRARVAPTRTPTPPTTPRPAADRVSWRRRVRGIGRVPLLVHPRREVRRRRHVARAATRRIRTRTASRSGTCAGRVRNPLERLETDVGDEDQIGVGGAAQQRRGPGRPDRCEHPEPGQARRRAPDPVPPAARRPGPGVASVTTIPSGKITAASARPMPRASSSIACELRTPVVGHPVQEVVRDRWPTMSSEGSSSRSSFST